MPEPREPRSDLGPRDAPRGEALLDACTAFQTSDSSVTMLDLSRSCEHASGALDNSVHGIPIILARTASDLEFAYHATAPTQHRSEAFRILDPVIASFEPDLQGQTFCDWCYAALSSRSVDASRVIGLASEYAFACDNCIASGAYWNAPEGWDGPDWRISEFGSPATP